MPKKKISKPAEAGRGAATEEADISLDELEKISTFVLANDLPDSFEGKVVNIRVTSDRKNRKCIFFTIELADKSLTKIKYTPMHIPKLAKALKNFGFTKLSEVKGSTFEFKRQYEKIGFPRHYPVRCIK